jgi:tetratricopeptide (TPR) repeat protein
MKMMRNNQCLIRLSLFLIAIATSSQAQVPVEMTRDFWRDPVFVNRFLGSYGFLSDAEPKINQDEVELFKELKTIIPNNPAGALTRINQSVNQNSSAALYFIRGNLNFQQGRLSAAASDYNRALNSFPDFRRAHKNLGLIYLQQENFEKAIESLAQAIELGDQDSRTFGIIAYSYYSMEQYLAAETSYRQAIARDSQNKDWLIGLSRSLAAMGEYISARSIIREMVAENPSNAQLWLFLVNMNINLDESEAAADIIELLRLRGQADSRSLGLLGNIYVNQQAFGMALDVYNELLTLSDGAMGASELIQVAEVMSMHGGFTEAELLVDSLLSQSGQEFDKDEKLQLLNLQAKLARARGEAETSAVILTEILELDPIDGEALIELADFYADQGEYERAFLLLDRAAKLNEFRGAAMRAKGVILVGQQRYADAAEALEIAYRSMPEDNRLRDYLAEVKRAARLQ